MEIKNHEFLKKENQSLVLEIIINQGPISRADIAKQTKMSPTSASRIVASLLDMALIKKVDIISNNGLGRKATYFVPNEDSVISVGVEIDSFHLRIGFMNFVGEIVVKAFYDHNNIDPQQTVNFISEKIQLLLQEEGIDADRIVGVCVGLPGLIQQTSGVVKLSAQLNWKQVHLGEMLEKKLGMPVVVDNDLKVKALAEYKLTSKAEDNNMVMIGLGNGVGSVLITNGEIYRGEGNFAGEIGHTTVDPYGVYCSCGKLGCLQTYIAEPFLLDAAAKVKPGIQSMEELVEEYEKGAQWAENIIEKAVTYAAITINNTVCIYSPDKVVLSGSLIENYPAIRKRLLEKYSSNIWYPVKDTFELLTTKTENYGVVKGAASSIQQEFVKNIKFNGEI
ncbi:ROK family transcriptional regulator [Sediminibacillus halophilus]|uniref:Sugar kinase of the NBD/HSP70 family, may contain an N-terminal HTH domain n=1 Tax=Sediminibacillus halophilus TaxID=482461 RepID=A0A1G9U9N4_9BACI|nr:ROK family transcriptional regulator [Sediminibacillus halophilus]SDM56651.1 Sugar kinase of the NBD/HSP70 family, may contain an N-terminal HTH domain [Sediminibacillus halophilus]